MKFHVLFPALLALAALFVSVSCREEVASKESAPSESAPQFEGTTYVMEMKGMVCGGCMMEVKDALAKVDEIPEETVAFKRGSRPETKKVVFTAKSATLTRENVVEALGEAAERLVIESFTIEENS